MDGTSNPYTETELPAWDGASYAANTGHHRVHDAAFLASLPARPADRLLDVGCGSGDFTAVVAAGVPDGHVVGVDPQPSMLAEATKRARANQSFVQGTAQRLVQAAGAGAPFDGVFSRATLHWVPWADHPDVLRQIAALTAPGGWVRLELGGHGNIARVIEVVEPISLAHGGGRAPWAFADAGSYLDLLERVGLDPTPGAAPHAGLPDGFVRTVAQRRTFSRDTLRGWLTSQCLEAFRADMAPPAFASFRDAVFAALDDLRRADGTYDQTFVRLDALAYRPS